MNLSVPKLSTSKINLPEWIGDASDADRVTSFEGSTGLNGTYKLHFANSEQKTLPISWDANSASVTSVLEGMDASFKKRITVSSSIGLDAVSHTVVFKGVNKDVP